MITPGLLRFALLRFSLLLAVFAALAHAQAPRPAQSSAPKPAAAKPGSAAPASPAASIAPPRVVATKLPPDTTLLPSLPEIAPPLAKLPAATLQKLPNGLQLVHISDPALPIVEVYLTIPLGYTHDPAGKRGLTRALAHALRFGGTASRTGDEIEDLLRKRQISLQAAVGPEMIEWAARCRADDLPDLLALLADMLSHPAFRRQAIEGFQANERAAIRNYGRRVDDSAAAEGEAAWFGKESPWLRLPTYDAIRALDRDLIVAHYKSHIGPARVLLGIDGDVDAATAASLAAKTFGSWQTAAPAASAPAPLPMPTRKLTVADQPNATSARLVLFQPWKQRASERTPAVAAALGMFAANWEDRQPESLTNVMKPFASEDGPVRVIAGLTHASIPALHLSAAVRPREAIDAAIALWKQMEKLRAEKITPARLDALRRHFLRSLVFQASSPQARFRLIMQAHALGLAPTGFEEIQKAAAALTPADYIRIVSEQVNLDAAQLVLAGDERDFRSSPDTIGFPLARTSLTPPAEPEYKPDTSEAGRQKALEALEQATAAMGGAALLDSIRDAVWNYEATLTRSSPLVVIKQRNSWLQPRLYRQEQSSDAGGGISYYDGSLGWIQANRNLQSLNPLVAQQFRNEVIRLLFRLVRAGRMEGYTVSYAGPAQVVIRSPENYAVEVALDYETHLPERLRFVEQRPNDGIIVRVEERLSDYKASGGVLMPHRIAVIQDGLLFADFVMTDIRFNTGLSEEEISRKP